MPTTKISCLSLPNCKDIVIYVYTNVCIRKYGYYQHRIDYVALSHSCTSLLKPLCFSIKWSAAFYLQNIWRGLMWNIMKLSGFGQRYSDFEGINQFSKHDVLHSDEQTKFVRCMKDYGKTNSWMTRTHRMNFLSSCVIDVPTCIFL